VLVVKSWGFLKNLKIRSGSYSGLGLSIYVKKMKLKSRWTVPLRPVQDIVAVKVLTLIRMAIKKKVYSREAGSHI
jgi:hypothetical protein